MFVEGGHALTAPLPASGWFDKWQQLDDRIYENSGYLTIQGNLPQVLLHSVLVQGITPSQPPLLQVAVTNETGVYVYNHTGSSLQLHLSVPDDYASLEFKGTMSREREAKREQKKRSLNYPPLVSGIIVAESTVVFYGADRLCSCWK